MITGIDHVVILVRDLAQAMDDYGRLGFTVELGGEHPGGTHNALVAFEDGAYLELIAFQRPEEPHSHPWYSALQHGEGLVAFAVGSTDLAGDAASIGALGVVVEEIQDGARLRPDGERLTWRTAGLGSGPRGRARPFIIEDVTARALRVASGRAARHANSVVGVVDVTLAVGDLARAGEEIAALLGVTPPAAVEEEGTRRARFTTPRGAIGLLQPTDPASDLGQAVATRGDHLYAATLGTMDQGGEPPYEELLAHGANLRFEPV